MKNECTKCGLLKSTVESTGVICSVTSTVSGDRHNFGNQPTVRKIPREDWQSVIWLQKTFKVDFVNGVKLKNFIQENLKEEREKIEVVYLDITKKREENVRESLKAELIEEIEKMKLPIPNKYGTTVNLKRYNQVMEGIISIINNL